METINNFNRPIMKGTRTMTELIRMERYIHSQVKTNKLTYYELLKYLEFLESINMNAYSEEDIQRYLNCLEDLYGDGETEFTSIRKGVKGIQRINFPPIHSN